MSWDIDTNVFFLYLFFWSANMATAKSTTPTSSTSPLASAIATPPTVHVWCLLHDGDGLYTSHAVYDTRFIANEVMTNGYKNRILYEYRPDDPRVWVQITDPTHKLRDQGMYCKSCPLTRLIRVELPFKNTVLDLGEVHGVHMTGKKLLRKLRFLGDFDVVAVPAENPKPRKGEVDNTPSLPHHSITKDTCLPFAGIETYKITRLGDFGDSERLPSSNDHTDHTEGSSDTAPARKRKCG